MTRRALAFLVIASVAAGGACSTPAELPFAIGTQTSTPTETLTPTPTPVNGTRTWRSWNVVMSPSGTGALGTKGTIVDDAGEMTANVQAWIGSLGSQPNAPMSYQPGSDSQVGLAPGYWAGDPSLGAGHVAPAFGKNSSARSSGDPAPTGVYDLEVVPPCGSGDASCTSSYAIVVAFMVPTSGTYAISGVSAHTVAAGGDGVTVKLGLDGTLLGAGTAVQGNAQWASLSGVSGQTLNAGDFLEVEVGPNQSSDKDAVELAFTINKTP